jgi:N-acetylmuramoyl-L-alanine amidase
MKKELGHFLFMLITFIIWGIICFLIIGLDKPTTEIKKLEYEPIEHQMMVCVINEPVGITENVQEVETGTICEVTYDEAQMLMKIAMAEAEEDGVEGQAMVMAVVLNRVKDNRFPNTIEEVIFQAHQFSPISDGRYFEAEPDVNSHLALAEIEKGNYEDVDALYFENAVSSWQADNCEYVGTVGHHRFYKN